MLPSLFLSSDTPTPPAGRTFAGSAGTAGFSFSFFISYKADSKRDINIIISAK